MAAQDAQGGFFAGTFIYTMDPKGRVIMPRRFRECLGTPFVLTKGIGGCLLAMPHDGWQPLVERYGEESIIFRRFYLAGAVECRPSPRSGRFLIPHPLREFAEILPAQEATVAGIGNAVEIWNKQRWERASQHPEERERRQARFELDLELGAAEPFTMRARQLLGISVLEAKGALDVRAGHVLAESLRDVASGALPAMVVDLRQATRLRTAPSVLRTALSEQRARGVTVCLLSEDPAASRILSRHAHLFTTLEDALWWLAEHDAQQSANLAAPAAAATSLAE